MKSYLVLGVIGLLAAAVAIALYYRGEAIQATALAAQERAYGDKMLEEWRNEIEVRKRLQAAEVENNKLVAELLAENDKTNTALAEANAALADLKDKDENVRSYLGTPVPDGLQRLYNH